MVTWDAPFVSLLQFPTGKTSITQQRFLFPAQQDARKFHISVHLQVGGLKFIEEAELWEQRRQWLWSWTPGCNSWACCPRKASSSWGGGTHACGLPTPAVHTATGSWAAAAVGPVILSLQPWRCLQIQIPACSSDTREPNNPKSACDPGSPYPPVPLRWWSLQPRKPQTRWRRQPSWSPGGDTSDISDTKSSKAPENLEAQAAVMRERGDISGRGSESGKCQFSSIGLAKKFVWVFP